MASNLLRKVKSTIPSTIFKHSNSSTSTTDRSSAAESPVSINTRLSLYPDLHASPARPPSPVTLRKRLARKASTLSLRTKSRRGDKVKKKKPSSTLVAASNTESSPVTPLSHARFYVDKELPQTPEPPVSKESDQSRDEKTPTQRNFSRPLSPPPTKRPPTCHWTKMAAESSSPPIPFLRLKEIANEVCKTSKSLHLPYSGPYLPQCSPQSSSLI